MKNAYSAPALRTSQEKQKVPVESIFDLPRKGIEVESGKSILELSEKKVGVGLETLPKSTTSREQAPHQSCHLMLLLASHKIATTLANSNWNMLQ